MTMLKKIIPITLMLIIVLTIISSATSPQIYTEDLGISPLIESSLTEMLRSFIDDRMEFHDVDYYIVYLNQNFVKGQDFEQMHHIWIDGKAIIPNHYYLDVIITEPVVWQYNNSIDYVYPSTNKLYHYRYFPNSGHYNFMGQKNQWTINNYGPELMFTNISNTHGKYEVGQYTLLNPKGNTAYWGTNINIKHTIKLFDESQIHSLISGAWGLGYNKGKEEGIDSLINESDAYNKGLQKGRTTGYADGFKDGQTTTDEVSRNILSFGGSVLGSVFSFILYVSTNVQILGIRLIDVFVALAIIGILVFVLKLIKG